MALSQILELVSNNFVLIFYTTIIILVYINRKKFDIQAKIIALYRTKLGLNLINRIGKKHQELIKILGYSGIGVGFIFMVVISYTIIDNLYKLLFVKDAVSGMAPVIPGVQIPGSPLFVPLISGWIALFIVMLIHEFSHGIVAVANNVKVKSSGIVFFGPIMGAFVEPDEKQLMKKPDVVQYSLFAAGPFSNILTAVIVIVLVAFVINPVFNSAVETSGFSLDKLVEGGPAQQAGITPSLIFTQVNNKAASNYTLLFTELDNTNPGDKILLSTNTNTYTVTTAPHPKNQSRAYIGANSITNHVEPKKGYEIIKPLVPAIIALIEFLWLLFILSLGIGSANLLPMGPTDGGRMLLVALTNIKGKKQGPAWWKQISIACFALLIINIVLGIAIQFFR